MPSKKKKYAKRRYKYEPKIYTDMNLAEQIVKMRIKGHTFADIAKQLHITYQWCQKLYKKVWEDQVNAANETVQHALKIDLARIDKLILRVNNLLDEALTPREHLEAIDCLNRLLDRRAKMLGLNAPEKRIEVSMGLDLNAMSPQELQGEMAKMGIDFDEKKLLEYKLPGEEVISSDPTVTPFIPKDEAGQTIEKIIQEVKAPEEELKDHHTSSLDLLVESSVSAPVATSSGFLPIEGRFDGYVHPPDSSELSELSSEEPEDHSSLPTSGDETSP